MKKKNALQSWEDTSAPRDEITSNISRYQLTVRPYTYTACKFHFTTTGWEIQEKKGKETYEKNRLERLTPL